MNKRKLLNIIIFIIVMVNWLKMVFLFTYTALTSIGLSSLKYFTVLSNLLEAAACVVWLINGNEKIKYIAAVSVTLTMVVVLTFLGPLFGYIPMFTGVSFWMHLIVPVAALLEVLFWSKEIFSKKDNLIACIPLGLYGMFYIGNNLINGRGQWPHTNDWYAFLTWGNPIGFLLFAAIVAVAYLIGLFIRKVRERH